MSDHLEAAREYAEAGELGDVTDAEALAAWADNLVDDQMEGADHSAALAELADDLEALGDTEAAASLREIIPTLPSDVT
jgi:hypothetical protein